MRIVTWSPAQAFFGMPYEAANFIIDVQRFARAMSGSLEPSPQVIVRASVDDLRALARLGEPIAVDIETAPRDDMGSWTGKDPTLAKLRTLGFGTCMRGLSFVWTDADDETRAEAARIIESPALLKVVHNGIYFDNRVLARYGMRMTNFHDTRDMRRALVSTSRLSLAHLTSIYTDAPAWKVADDPNSEKAWASDDETELMKYNALDCVFTARVYRGLVRDYSEAA